MMRPRKGEREQGRKGEGEPHALPIRGVDAAYFSPPLPLSLSPLLPCFPSPLPRRAYTLLEVILALALAVVVLGLVGVGIHVHLGVAAKSRGQVEEAQLARVLLQRIADDLRNAVPFQPPPSSSSLSSSSSSSSSGGSGQAGASGTSNLASSSGTSDSTSTAPLSGGIYGTAQAIQIETARRPRATLVSLQTAKSDPSQPARLSDLRVVSYSLGAPTTVDLSQQSPPSPSGTGGLYRHEQDRAEFYYGSQNGQTDNTDPKTELLAPEVVDFKLTYYGGTGALSSGTSGSGTTSSSGTSSDGTSSSGTSTADTTGNGTTDEIQWDSTQEGMLPVAVRISISLRRDAPKSMLSLLDTEKRPPVVYSLLVSLPNASVDAVGWASQETASAATPYAADANAKTNANNLKNHHKTNNNNNNNNNNHHNNNNNNNNHHNNNNNNNNHNNNNNNNNQNNHHNNQNNNNNNQNNNHHNQNNNNNSQNNGNNNTHNPNTHNPNNNNPANPVAPRGSN